MQKEGHAIVCKVKEIGDLTIQDFNLHIPEVTHSRINSLTLRWNTAISLLWAVKIDAVRKWGMNISESCIKKSKQLVNAIEL